MKDKNYTVIQGWMVNRLKLSGNELIVYAIIYGFSQDGKSMFTGACQYLADSTGISRRSIMPILNKLVKRGFIKKYDRDENGVKLCSYQAISKYIPKSKEGGYEETSQGMKNVPKGCEDSSQGGYEETSHNNTINHKLDNINLPPVSTAGKKDVVVSKKETDLTPEQLTLYHAAKMCFESEPKTKAILYQDKQTTARELKHIKTLILRCANIAPDIPEGFLKNVLEHFRILTNGKLKGKAVFTPRALITPWIWESVIDSLPTNTVTPELSVKIRRIFG